MVDGNGEPLFEIQKFEMVCDDYRKTEEPWKCNHMGATTIYTSTAVYSCTRR